MEIDRVLRGGMIADGAGTPLRRGDVAIVGDRVVAIGPSSLDFEAAESIDVSGMVVAPGFVDIHSHHDLYMADDDPERWFVPYLRQGVTTCVVGNCGWSMAPCVPETRAMLLELIRSMSVPVQRFPWEGMGQYLAFLEALRLPCNVAQLVGHGALRIAAMGDENRFATQAELRRMKTLLHDGLEAGCVGLSTGLMYYPGMYAHTDELVELARVAAAYDRPYASHLRGYCSTLPFSIAEAIEIAERAAVRVQISHLHVVPFFGRLAGLATRIVEAAETLNRVTPLAGLPSLPLRRGMRAIENAVKRGLRVAMDAVPYTLGNTTVTALFPPSANRGGRARLLQRLRDPVARDRIRREIDRARPRWPHWEPDSWSDPYPRAIGWHPIRVLAVRRRENRWAEGKSFVDIARAWDTDPFQALCRLTLEEEGEATFSFGYPASSWVEKMLYQVFRHPDTSFGADAILPIDGAPPRSAYGCFPRVLGRYCRELKLFSLEEAVRRITSLPADIYGLGGRGRLREGAFADIVVFDPRTIGEGVDGEGRPTFPAGIHHVFVNGVPVVSAGRCALGTGAGRLLRS